MKFLGVAAKGADVFLLFLLLLHHLPISSPGCFDGGYRYIKKHCRNEFLASPDKFLQIPQQFLSGNLQSYLCQEQRLGLKNEEERLFQSTLLLCRCGAFSLRFLRSPPEE